jgi:[ribosomal protein S18]-alanine N-acetyltransferase
VTARLAVAEDAGQIAAIHAASFARPWTVAEFRALLGQRGVFALLAGEPASAFILCRGAGEEAEILTLATAPASRRRGLGRMLVAAARAEAAGAGARALFLEVAEDNAGALALYRSAGFGQAGVRRGYYARPSGSVDALVLRCDLNSATP